MTVLRRAVARITDPQLRPGGTSAHTARVVLEPGRWEEFDPFLVLMEDWFTAGTFGPHPHRGIETFTYVIDGALAHEDNHGGRGALGPGDAQLMTAGRGVIHSEAPSGERVHTLQLWINLPAALKMTEPRYQDLRAAALPTRREGGAEVRVFAGASGGVAAPTLTHNPLSIVEVRLEPGAAVRHDLPASFSAFALLLEGDGRFGEEGTPVSEGQVAWFSRDEDASPDASEITIRAADRPLRALVVAGQPLREPVVAHGPFVMNTPDEIRQAYADFRAGRF